MPIGGDKARVRQIILNVGFDKPVTQKEAERRLKMAKTTGEFDWLQVRDYDREMAVKIRAARRQFGKGTAK